MNPASAGSVVLGVKDGSPAASRLHPHNRVLAIDGTATTSDGSDRELPLVKVLALTNAWAAWGRGLRAFAA